MAYTITTPQRSVLTRAQDQLRSFWLSLSLTNPSDARKLAGLSVGGTSAAGVPVNEHTAFNLSAVWSAVGLISGHTAVVPLNHYKRLEKGGKERVRKSNINRMFHVAMNPEMSAFVGRETLQAHVMLWGNGYAEIEWDGAGRPLYLWPIEPSRVTARRNALGQVEYVVWNPSRPNSIVPAEDMLHIPGLGFDGITGYSVVSIARESFGLGMAAERFGNVFFGEGSTFGGILAHPGELSPEAKKGIRDDIEKQHKGVERAHRFLVLEEGMKYERIGIPPNDAQFLETRKFQIEEVARWFNLPPHKLKHLERSTNNNIEHQGIEYYTDTLLPWYVRWEQEVTRKLIPPLEQNIQFIEHNVEGLLRGDSQSRAEYNSKMFGIGGLTINQLLEQNNMNPIGPTGDVRFVPTNLQTLEKALAPTPEPAPPMVPPAGKPGVPPAGNDDAKDDAEDPKPTKRDIDEAIARLEQALRSQCDEDSALIRRFNEQILEATTRATLVEGELVRAQIEVNRLGDELQLANQATQAAVEARGDAEARLEQVTRAHDAATERNGVLEASAVATAAEVEQLRRDILLASERLESAAADAHRLREERAADHTRAAEEIDRLRVALEREASNGAAAAERVRSLEAQVVDLEAAAAAVRADRERVVAENVALEQVVRDSAAAYEERLAAAQAETGRVEVARQVLASEVAAGAGRVEALTRDLEEARATLAAGLSAAEQTRSTLAERIAGLEADLAAAARAAETEREARLAAVADGEHLMRSLHDLQALLDASQGRIAGLEADTASYQETNRSLEASLAASRAETDVALETAADLQSGLAQLRTEHVSVVAGLEAAVAEQRALVQSEQAGAVARIADLEARTAATIAEYEASLASAGEQLTRATADLSAMRDRMHTSEVEAARRVAAAEALTEETQRLREAAERALEVTVGRERQVQEQLSEARLGLAVAERTAQDALEEASTARAQQSDAVRAVEDAERRLEDLRRADAGQVSGVIAAHRALVVDTMQRMVERETDRIRRRSHMPEERFRKAIDEFYEEQEAVCLAALLPCLRIHLAWTGSVENPVDATRRLVQAHIAESRRQLSAVLSGDADHVATSLPALLRRWESERVTTIGDALMQKELDYARSL